jgi:hypothetical protein
MDVLRLYCANFIEEGWSLEEPLIYFLPTESALLNMSPTRTVSPMLFFFFKCFDREFWEYLLLIINNQLSILRENVCKKERSRYKPAKLLEVIKFYAVIMLLETTSGNDSGTLKEHLVSLDQKYDFLLEAITEQEYLSKP